MGEGSPSPPSGEIGRTCKSKRRWRLLFMAGRFAEKSVLIAGGTGALGRAIAVAFLEESAYVIVTYRRQKEFVALNKTAAAAGLSLEGYQVDVTDEGAVRRLTAQLLASHGRIDVLVNAVGGYAGGQPLLETDSKTFDQMFALSMRSGDALCSAIVPVMMKQRSGANLTVSSRVAFDHAAGV